MLVSFISQPCLYIFQPNLCYYLSYVSSARRRKLNVWAAYRLVLLDMLFYQLLLDIISLKVQKPHKHFCLLLNFCKNGLFVFTLRKTGTAKTRAARLFPLTLLYKLKTLQLLFVLKLWNHSLN